MNTDAVAHAIDVANKGGIVIFPTDTAFGIGCRIDRQETVDRLFSLRKRPRTMAMPVLVSAASMALPYYDSPSHIVRRLMKQYWPGALTIVARCKTDLIYSPIRGGGDTIGMRMPDHTDTRSFIEGVGVPILGTSANFHGNQTPFTLDDLDSELVRLVDYVLPGVCKRSQVSTVIDMSVHPPVILRQGAVHISVEDTV